MKVSRLLTVVGVLAFAASCERHPTSPDTPLPSFDTIDPIVVTFNASQGLPGGPIGQAGGSPFLGGLPFGGAPSTASDGKGPGAAFPDSIKLSDAQKTQIQQLVMTFLLTNAADLATMRNAFIAAHVAIEAGKPKADVQAIFDAAKPAADRVHAAADALRTAITNLLTPLQQIWVTQHRPDHPPHTP